MQPNQSKTILFFLMAFAIGEITARNSFKKIQKDESSQNHSSSQNSVPLIQNIEEISQKTPEGKPVLYKKEGQKFQQKSVDLDEDSQTRGKRNNFKAHKASNHSMSDDSSSQVSQKIYKKGKANTKVIFKDANSYISPSNSVKTIENFRPHHSEGKGQLKKKQKTSESVVIKDLTHNPSVENKSHRSNPLTGQSTQRSMTKLLKGEGSRICKKTLLSLFGIKGTLQDNSITATPMEKSYCRRNDQSCCSAYNIESTNKEFSKGVYKLKKKFEVLEEVFALFKGPKFFDFITAYMDKGECRSHVDDLELELEGHTYKYFDETYQMYQKEMMDMILMDTEMYFKKNIWFYGDSICSICNPKIQEYFEVTKQGSSLAVNVNMCSERIEEREYERNLLLIYERHVSHTVKFVDCVLEADEAEEVSANSENDAKEVLELIDQTQRDEFLEMFDKCYEDKGVEDEECQHYCSKPLAWFQFPIDNLMHNFKVSLAILYKSMNDGEISEYYEDIKGMEWKIEDENEPIYFYKVSSDWEDYHMEDIEWTFHKTSGHNVYREIMSKRYLHYEFDEDFGSVKVLSSILIGFFALLF